MITFASIVKHFDVAPNALYRERDRRLRRGLPVTDLVSGNVSAHGIQFPLEILRRALRDGERLTRVYKPDPLGQHPAREAISRYYAHEGLKVPANQIVLTPGTSLSYWYAFKLLADPGDEILAPSPSYPLFDSIAALCGVRLAPYKLRPGKRWEIDFASLESAITPRTKAIVLISPHNPTGAVATHEEVRKLAQIASQRGLAIISDEVFSPFVFTGKPLPRPAQFKAPLVITLNGLSKMLALPGMKIGWMALTGNPVTVKKALGALDMISDTFLPVNEIAQSAVPRLLKESKSFQKSYVSKIVSRMNSVTALLRNQKNVSFIEPEGGFFMALKLEGRGVDEEETACRLLQKHGIIVHPGYFYDIPGQHLVFSFVHRQANLKKTLKIILSIAGGGGTPPLR